MNPVLTAKQIELITDYIQTELLKRGVTARITKFEETVKSERESRLDIETESFQTTPVMFKSLMISDFGASIFDDTTTRSDDTTIEHKSFYIPLHFRYEHFDGGSNGSHLLTIRGTLFEDQLHMFTAENKKALY